jgi:5-hydroxyisourate hydrolase-like protein (transthyretin family)
MIFLLFVLFVVLPQAAGLPAADAPPATAEMSGRITDLETGQPIPRAVVHLAKVPDQQSFVTLTDEDGRWQLTGLSPGYYMGRVQPGQFRATHLEEPLLSAGPQRGAIEVKPGEKLKDVNVALRRSLAIAVRVVDEWGEPLSGMMVTVGTRSGAVRRPGMMQTTDDRGEFRFPALTRGDYVVCAEPWPTSDRGNSQFQILRTCYPSAAGDASAERVKVERADVEGIEIRMRRGRTFRISGQVLDASGAPATLASVSLERSERGMSSGGMGSPVEKDGRFAFSNLVPGNYAVRARLGGSNGLVQAPSSEAGFVAVRVDAADIDGLVISMAKPIDVAGRIVLEDPAASFTVAPGWAPPFLMARLATDKGPGFGSSSSAHPDDKRSFKFQGLFGKRMIEVANVPRGWYVKSIRYRGTEVIDTPTDFAAGSDPAELEIVVSNRGAVVSGRVTDDAGNPVRGARVLVLSTNPDRWTELSAYSAGRRATSSADGSYRLGPQREGDYFVAALPSVADEPPAGDREQLTRIAGMAERVTLAPDEKRSLDLRVIKPE